MSKVKYSDWQKIVKANTRDVEIVRFQVGEDEYVEVEVTPQLSLTDRIAFINTVVDSCCPLPYDYQYDDDTPEAVVNAHRRPSIEYIEPVFRATVLQYYTNLDLSTKKADLEVIWELARNDDVYDPIVDKIKDSLWEMEDYIYKKIRAKMGNREELAGRIMSLLNRIEAAVPQKVVNEFADLLNQADQLGLDRESLLKLVGGDDAE